MSQTISRQTSGDTAPQELPSKALKTGSKSYPQKLRQTFPDLEDAVATFSVGYLSERRQTLGLQTLSQCVATPYPTLQGLALAYNTSECPMLLLEAYITNLNDSCNATRMNESQTREAGEIMYQEAPYLKITEIHEFFRRIKAGYYGEYYGSLDVLKIMADFRQFLRDRVDTVRRIQNRERTRLRRQEWEQRQKMWNEQHSK